MKIKSTVRKKGGKPRKGKGFSRGELRDAGVDPKQALKFGIPIDPRRRTKHEENVKMLKRHLRSLVRRSRRPRTAKKL